MMLLWRTVMVRPVLLVLALAIPGWLIPAAASAQAPPVTAGFDNGFFIEGNNGDYRLAFGLVLQADGRFSTDDPPPITNTLTIRKARPAITGRFTKYFEFKVMPDFAGGNVTLQDAFIDTRFSNAFRIRMGKDKTPVGYEWLIGDSNVYFVERALPSTLVPLRDVGIQALGDLAAGKISYQGGLFNGVPDGTNAGDVDTNSAKDVAGRLLVMPFRAANRASPLSGLGFHVGGSVGRQANALPTLRTSAGQAYFAYAPGATADGRRTRITPAAFYFYKSFGVFGEYVLSTQDVARLGATRDIANHAMEITTTYFLTGERASTSTTRPAKPFDPPAGHWGAVQLLARYSHLEVDGDAFVNGLAAAGASRRADQWSAGLDWFPLAFVKWYAMYERTTFDQHAPGSRPIENVILFRAQFAF